METKEEIIQNLLDNEDGWRDIKKQILEDLILFGKAGMIFRYDKDGHPEHLVVEYYDPLLKN